MKRYILLLLLFPLLTGCGTSLRVTELNSTDAYLPARSPQSVDVFTSGIPDRPYIELFLISARQQSEFSGDEVPEIIQKMREKAAEEGCDALIITGTNDEVEGDGFYVSTLQGFHGVCAVYD